MSLRVIPRRQLPSFGKKLYLLRHIYCGIFAKCREFLRSVLCDPAPAVLGRCWVAQNARNDIFGMKKERSQPWHIYTHLPPLPRTARTGWRAVPGDRRYCAARHTALRVADFTCPRRPGAKRRGVPHAVLADCARGCWVPGGQV
jgi:hypothetical protein